MADVTPPAEGNRRGRLRGRPALRLLQTAVLSGAIAWTLLAFVGQVFRIQGASMTPALRSDERVLVDKLSVRFASPERGEVVVFRDPAASGAVLVKRILALPGETVRFLGDEVAVVPVGREDDPCSRLGGPGAVEVTLGPDEYFAIGDNRARSSDSRQWGALRADSILGRVRWRVYPPTRVGRIAESVALAAEPCR